MKRLSGITLIALLICVVFISCWDDNITNPPSTAELPPLPDNPLSLFAISSAAGELHNNLLDEFYSTYDPDVDGKLTDELLARGMASAINAVSGTNAMSEDDIHVYFAYFDLLRDIGIFDWRETKRGYEEYERLVNHVTQAGLLSDVERSDILSLIRSAFSVRDVDCKFTVSLPPSGGANPTLSLGATQFFDIAGASLKYWTATPGDGNTGKGQLGPKLLSPGTYVIIADAVGALVGLFVAGPYGSIIGAAVESVIINEEINYVPPGGGGSGGGGGGAG